MQHLSTPASTQELIPSLHYLQRSILSVFHVQAGGLKAKLLFVRIASVLLNACSLLLLHDTGAPFHPIVYVISERLVEPVLCVVSSARSLQALSHQLGPIIPAAQNTGTHFSHSNSRCVKIPCVSGFNIVRAWLPVRDVAIPIQ